MSAAPEVAARPRPLQRPKSIGATIAQLDRSVAKIDAAGDDWRTGLLRDARQQVLGNLANVMHALRNAPELSGTIERDDFAKVVRFGYPPPWHRSTDRLQREWTDEDTVLLQEWLQRNCQIPVAQSATVRAAVRAVAGENARDPLRDYFRRLTWDGLPRLATWLRTYLGAEPIDETHATYLRAVGTKWMIGAAARGLRAAVKHDCALILIGAQGARKTSATHAICPNPDWYCPTLPTFDREGALQLAGKFIVEIAELAAFGRSDIRAIKDFMSRTVDRYRAPYDAAAADHPRRAVFIGTTNSETFVADTTGARRFWPVQVGQIELEALEHDRDQLWAEAVHRHLDGEPHWLIGDEIMAAAPEQEAIRVARPWEEDLLDFLDTVLARSEPHVAMKEILRCVFGVDTTTRESGGVAAQAAEMLARWGWQRSKPIGRGERRRVVYTYTGTGMPK